MAPLLSLLWCCRELQNFRLAVVGDLHLVPDQLATFDSAQQHLNDALLGSQHSSNGTGCTGRSVGRLVQLGDLGGYEVRPGMLPDRMPCLDQSATMCPDRQHVAAPQPRPDIHCRGLQAGSRIELDQDAVLLAAMSWFSSHRLRESMPRSSGWRERICSGLCRLDDLL